MKEKKLMEQIEAGEKMITEESDLKVSEIREIKETATDPLDMIGKAFYTGVYRGHEIQQAPNGAEVPTEEDLRREMAKLSPEQMIALSEHLQEIQPASPDKVWYDLDKVRNELDRIIYVIDTVIYSISVSAESGTGELNPEVIEGSLTSVNDHIQRTVDDLGKIIRKI